MMVNNISFTIGTILLGQFQVPSSLWCMCSTCKVELFKSNSNAYIYITLMFDRYKCPGGSTQYIMD